jgi:hypothetical protein
MRFPRSAALAPAVLLAAACTPEADGSGEPEGEGASPDASPEGFSWGEARSCEEPVEGFLRLRDEAAERGLGFEQGGGPGSGFRSCVNGSGVVAEDLDGDGDPDVLTRSLEAPRIFGNDGTGHFVEQSEKPDWDIDWGFVDSFGVLDVSGDGLPELLYLGYGFARISSNLGDLHWGDPEPVWEADASVDADERPMFLTATWGDVDGDGDLDLLLPTVRQGIGQVTPGQGLPPPGVHYLLRNDGAGTWTELARLTPRGEPNYVQVATFTDRDGDGDQDLLLASEHGLSAEPTAFFRNDGVDGADGPLLVNDAGEIGADVRPAAMGVDGTDLNGDGALDYCMSNVGPLVCIVSDGAGGYVESALALGLDAPPDVSASTWTTWSVEFVDLQNDGWEDLATAGGPIYPGEGTAHPDAVFEREPGGGFV